MNNKNCYLFFAGYYMVARASDVLCRYNIENRIVRAPVYMQNSCNFALLINGSDEDRSCILLEREGICIEKKTYAARKF